jgi:hypothetical protein
MPAPAAAEPPDFTDADLRAALWPVIAPALPALAPFDEEQLIARLEPLLRAAVRRALAESDAPGRRPFRAPGLWDRFRWRLTALLTSRTYQEVLFEKTRRFRVEEVFLLDARTLAMISYASDDPARHAQPQRVLGTARHLARHLKDPNGGLAASFGLPEQRTARTITGRAALLVAVTRGQINDLVLADLAFCLSRLEARFHDRLRTPGEPLLAELQPFLEDCLLIQSPPAG